jgi:hypothetical protein
VIRVQRGPEPPALATARQNHLDAATKAHAENGTVPKDLLVGYASTPVQKALYSAQHGKCAWCEETVRQSGTHVEHYRPKNGAWRHRRSARSKQIDAHCYWWLCWSWQNLLLSCGPCNNPAHKGNYFWLATPWTASPPGAWPAPHDVATEHPLLIDPASQDPLDHIVWRVVDPSGHRRLWEWTPWGLSTEGTATIEMLRLDWQLVDQVTRHLSGPLLGAVEGVEGHLAAGRVADANTSWDQLLADYLGPTARYRAACWCALTKWGMGAHGLVSALARP